MKKVIPKILVIGLFAALIFVGKYFIDLKTFNYRDTVNNSLTQYYISGDVNDLKPIIELLNNYSEDTEYTKSLQDYSAGIVTNWFLYLDNKYICNYSNKNSCTAQHSEFVTMLDKLNKLYEYKANNNYTIIVPSTYNTLKGEAENKITQLNKIVISNSALNPKTIEQIRINKCNSTNDCENCRENDACTCYYIDNKTGTKETLACYGKYRSNR